MLNAKDYVNNLYCICSLICKNSPDVDIHSIILLFKLFKINNMDAMKQKAYLLACNIYMGCCLYLVND